LKYKERALIFITGTLCIILIIFSFLPVFGYSNITIFFSLCIILTSIAFLLYVPISIKLNRQLYWEKLNRLPYNKLEKWKQKNPEFFKELEEEFKKINEKDENTTLEPHH